jgi:xanthine dehydrogenase YagR molybdenum-binding subunit
MARGEKAVGKPIDRVDGKLKVTGAARYAAEARLEDVAHAVLVLSTIPKGRVLSIDTARAEKAPGVLAVITHKNAPEVLLPEKAKASVDPPVGRPLQPLQDDRVHYHGQPIAVVVADTFERATHAAALVKARYREERAVLDFAKAPGYRPHTVQKVALGATRRGKLTAIDHLGTAQTSTYEEYTESLLEPTRFLYACPNVRTRYRLAALNVNTPASMRAPGEASGVYALECALDELATVLRIDPLELRLLNHADRDPESGKPWSSKSLKECYQKGAEKFGWARRKPAPRSLRDGKVLVGWGIASATWPTHRRPATVLVRLRADGTALVRTAASDIGPGTYTVMTQIAADALGLPVARVTFELGDSRMPQAPVQGGSMTVASVGSAVLGAARAARDRVLALARADEDSPLYEAKAEDVRAEDGRLFLESRPARGETYKAILSRHRKEVIEEHKSRPGEEVKKFSMHAFGAHFVEVRVDPDFGTVRVARVVSALAAGKIINPKTAHSQAIGGVVGGLGMALLEEAIRDGRNGRVVNANLADYLVPVHADVPDLEAFFVEEEDPHVNPLGAKGLAELSLVGVAAAVANGVWHATGKRVRDLPITPDKLL